MGPRNDPSGAGTGRLVFIRENSRTNEARTNKSFANEFAPTSTHASRQERSEQPAVCKKTAYCFASTPYVLAARRRRPAQSPVKTQATSWRTPPCGLGFSRYACSIAAEAPPTKTTLQRLVEHLRITLVDP
ncbi:hypothetical protein D9M68_558850 [compost metagenome]